MIRIIRDNSRPERDIFDSVIVENHCILLLIQENEPRKSFIRRMIVLFDKSGISGLFDKNGIFECTEINTMYRPKIPLLSTNVTGRF